MEKLTDQEKQFILHLLSRFQINPLAADAMDVLALIQSAAKKIAAPDTEEKQDG